MITRGGSPNDPRDMKPSTSLSLFPSICAAALLFAPGCDLEPDIDLDGDTDTDSGGTDPSATVGDDDSDSDSDSDGESGSSGGGDCELLEQSDVDDDLTLPAGCYLVEWPLFLQGTELTMEPGVDVAFGASAGLTLAGGAVLSAVGTPDDPVLLHGETADAGSWSGLSFADAPSSANRLEQVILDGGSVDVSASSRLAVVDSQFSGSEGVGLEAIDGAEITVSGSSFLGHERPLSVGYTGAPGIAADNVFMDNEDEAVLVTGNTLADAATWAALGVPWELESRVSVRAPLTLEPGATVLVRQGQSILVTTDGQLNATGTADAPITFTGVEPEVGYWVGIEFSSNSSNNVLEHAVVDYAGGDDWYGGGDAAASLFVPAEGRLTLRNVTIRNSPWYGLLAVNDSELGEFSGVTFADSQRAMKIAVDLGGMIPADTGFVNIAEPVVNIGFGNNDRVRTAQSWAALSIPWQATTRFFVETDWALDAGLVFWGAQDMEFIIEEGGTIHVAGTPNDPVTLGSPEQVAGFWKGVRVNSASANNLIENAVIEYAGSSGWYGGADREAAVYVDADGILELDGVTIRESAGNGILNDGAISCGGVVFEAIAKDDYVSNGGTGTCG